MKKHELKRFEELLLSYEQEYNKRYELENEIKALQEDIEYEKNCATAITKAYNNERERTENLEKEIKELKSEINYLRDLLTANQVARVDDITTNLRNYNSNLEMQVAGVVENDEEDKC